MIRFHSSINQCEIYFHQCLILWLMFNEKQRPVWLYRGYWNAEWLILSSCTGQTFSCNSIHSVPLLRSNNSDSTVRSTESVGVRQPAKSKIRRHNNRISTVFNHSPNLRDNGRGGHAQGSGSLAGDLQVADDPAELSCQRSVPGILKIFGSDICQGTNYKSVLATTQSSAKELVKEALDRWGASWHLLVMCYRFEVT